MNFVGLTGETGAAPGRNTPGKMWPNIAGRKEATRSLNAGMCQAMDMLEKNMPNGMGNQWAENGSGEVTKEGSVTNHMSVALERGRNFKSLNLQTGGLLLC